MAFRNMRFPTGVRYGSTMGPMYSTRVAESLSGKSFANKNWSYPLRTFRVTRWLKTGDFRAELLRFFHNVNGAGDTFRIKDHSDFSVGLSGSAATGVFASLGNGQYQMRARYTSGAYTKDIPIYLPVNGTVVVNNGSYSEGVHYSLDYSVPSGVLTLLGSPTPAAPMVWRGQYDVLAALMTDEFPLTFEDEELQLTADLEIRERRP